ncbi:MAG TPA: hypothetical protein VGK63_10295 [Candidatus Limnocylindrales bacterium]
MPDPALVLRLEASEEERRVLRAALLAARATELGELRRRSGRLAYGYGSDTARDGMRSEVDRIRLRLEMLDRLLAAVDESGTIARRTS